MKKANAALKHKAPVEAAPPEVDFDELPTYIGYVVRRTQAALFGEFEATLADVDFTPGSFGVLTLIRANPGITQVALAAAFGVDKSTMSPVVVRLERGPGAARGAGQRPALPCAHRSSRAAEAAFPGRADQKVRAFEGRRGRAPVQVRAGRVGPAAAQAAGHAGLATTPARLCPASACATSRLQRDSPVFAGRCVGHAL